MKKLKIKQKNKSGLSFTRFTAFSQLPFFCCCLDCKQTFLLLDQERFLLQRASFLFLFEHSKLALLQKAPGNKGSKVYQIKV